MTSWADPNLADDIDHGGDSDVDGHGEVDSNALIAGLAHPTDWRTLTGEDRTTAWRQLREWVQWFVQRYGLDARLVPPCWYLHPALVDLRSALRDQHRAAHQRLSPGSAPATWQVTFVQLEPRLRDWTARTGCTRDTHREEPAITWPADQARWQQHLNGDTR